MYSVNPAEAPSIIAANPNCKGVMPVLSTAGGEDINVVAGTVGALLGSAVVDVDEEIIVLNKS